MSARISTARRVSSDMAGVAGRPRVDSTDGGAVAGRPRVDSAGTPAVEGRPRGDSAGAVAVAGCPRGDSIVGDTAVSGSACRTVRLSLIRSLRSGPMIVYSLPQKDGCPLTRRNDRPLTDRKGPTSIRRLAYAARPSRL